MDDLVQWLGEQLDEDERIARAACWDEQSDVWTARPPQASYERYTVVDYCDDAVVSVTPENADADGVGRHVAEHDPARVLREIDATRQLLALHEPAEMEYVDGDVCMACDVRGGEPFYPCKTLRLLTLPYADRPGYREEWRP
ncbi:DUF6221 family protein [Streptomyces alfalfae]|uniref:Uncharacterized protein n=1 Tax=Streptomyces alfalfae TaxID=1642299 RepID=A0A7T4TY21_9ACTN|nr:DUF6221 family protein [Streptomyces alfalfae]QQC89839.1 hypothetical protein I8755_16530 [Streptomyces alfalfae]